MRTSFILDKTEMEGIISQCDVCFVGIVEADGTPYVIPMNFGYVNDEIILHSAPEGKHLSLLELNNRVCVTFSSGHELVYQHPDVACSYSMTSKSVLCKGVVYFVEDLEEKANLMNILMRNYTDREFKYSIPALRNVKVWRVKVDEMTGKSFGQNFKKSSDL
ncbi:MAG: pyridoxamine 5'-phosphate oxidase family protein [Paludibacter sp.]|nr:pyridoxamine 5'-phosphate oxidase family protein [Paludibacter sp.]